jgi:hypothetical protein
VVGEGEERDALRVKADQLGVANRVHWLGTLERQALPELYRRSIATVMPSRNEGLGLVAVESQLSCTPVICYASGGLTDVVSREWGGTLVPTGDTRALADAMQAHASDAELADSDDEETDFPVDAAAKDVKTLKKAVNNMEDDGEEEVKITFEQFMKMIQEAGFALEEMAASKDYPDADAVHSDETPQDSSKIGNGGENVEQSDLNLEEILDMLEAEDASIQEESEPSEEMASETKALQEELAEYRQAVNILRGKLNEVNLLNAKLLFTNKIFRKEGLTNEQKITIVENFDRATSVREVKMVYAVLAETLTVDVKQSKVKLPRKVVAEGLASKPMKSTAPTVNTAEIISENSFTKRLQQLAGII